MDADGYLEQVRLILQEPSADADQWEDTALFEYLTWAAAHVHELLTQATQGNWFTEETATAISTVSGTQEYEIPVGPDGTKMIYLKGVFRTTDGTFLKKVPYVDRKRWQHLGISSRLGNYPEFYYPALPKIGVVPEPSANLTDVLKCAGVFAHPAMAAGGSAPKFDDYLACRRACIMRAAMFAKRLLETSDSTLADEYRDAVRDLHLFLSQVSEEEDMRHEQEDGW